MWVKKGASVTLVLAWMMMNYYSDCQGWYCWAYPGLRAVLCAEGACRSDWSFAVESDRRHGIELWLKQGVCSCVLSVLQWLKNDAGND